MNKNDASKYLGIGQRTLERHTSAGRITARRIRTPNGPALDYEEAELERFKAILESPEPQVLAEPSPPSPPPMTAPVVPSASAASSALARIEPQVLARVEAGAEGAGLALVPVELLASLVARAEAEKRPSVEVADKLTLSLEEAAALSGLSRGHLRAAIGAGELAGRKIGRGWRVKRRDLESYVENL